jgi:hypothetical protein
MVSYHGGSSLLRSCAPAGSFRPGGWKDAPGKKKIWKLWADAKKIKAKISQKIFKISFMKKLQAKKLSGTRDECPVRDFPKSHITSFARIPASKPRLMHSDPENRIEKTALPFIPAEPSPSGTRSAVQIVLRAVFSKLEKPKKPQNEKNF